MQVCLPTHQRRWMAQAEERAPGGLAADWKGGWGWAGVQVAAAGGKEAELAGHHCLGAWPAPPPVACLGAGTPACSCREGVVG